MRFFTKEMGNQDKNRNNNRTDIKEEHLPFIRFVPVEKLKKIRKVVFDILWKYKHLYKDVGLVKLLEPVNCSLTKLRFLPIDSLKYLVYYFRGFQTLLWLPSQSDCLKLLFSW